MTNFNYEGSYEVGVSLYFWIITFVNIQLALYSHVRCNPLDTSETPLKHLHMIMTNLTMRAHNFQVSFVILLLKLILADIPTNASWIIHYGMYFAAILDSSRKGGNFFLFLNN